MKKPSSFLLFLAGLLFGALSASASTTLLDYFRSLATFESRFTQEKVYVHLDNNAYLMGETIWFKVYAVRASTLVPTSLSRVAYIELYDGNGELVERKTVELKQGMGHGEFVLDRLLHSGYYEIRAYTRLMLNWEGTAFSRVVPVFEQDKEELPGSFATLSLYKPPVSKELPQARPQPAPLTWTTTETKKDYRLTFFPEGGSRIAGLSSRLAYKLTDKGGKALADTCRLYAANGRLLAASVPLHEGMGWLIASAEAAYAEVGTVRFDLPEPLAAGCTMEVATHPEDVHVKLMGNEAFAPQTIGVSLTCRGLPAYLDTLGLTNHTAELRIPATHLRDGVNCLTLFAANGNILAERLLWKAPVAAQLPVLQVKQNRSVFSPFSPVWLHFDLKSGEGKAEQGVFSLSVRDEQGEIIADDTQMRTDLLLTSDLRGYIQAPSYYLAADDEEHRQALDLLLAVQGWRRYDYQQVADIQLKHPVEEGLLLDGVIQDLSRKRRAQKDVRVDAAITLLGQKTLAGHAVTDATGSFSMLANKFYGIGYGTFITSLAGKVKNYRVVLNRAFRPKLRGYELAEMEWQPYLVAAEERKETARPAVPPELFEWEDTFKGRVIALPQAQVTAKRFNNYASGRYNWMGGEKYGLNHASLYYNLEDEMEAVMDRGDEIPSVWDWLEGRNRYFDFELSETGKLTCYYKNRPVQVFLDNKHLTENMHVYPSSISCADIRSLVIAEDGKTLAIDTEEGRLLNASDGAVILLYSEENAGFYDHRKGIRPMRFHGYSLPAEFYNPNYYGDEMPVKNDFHRTLFWSPQLITDKDGKAEVSFFSNARDGAKLRMTVRGFSAAGKIIEYER